MAKKRTRRSKSQASATELPKSPPKQAAFLAAYAVSGLIGKAAKAAGCDRSSHQYWLDNDPEYPAKFSSAQDDANEVLEAEARRRAVQGTERMKFYKGEPIIDPRTKKPYIEHEYSDRLLELGLKAHLPEKYTDRQKIENVDHTTPDEYDQAYYELAEQTDIARRLQEDSDGHAGSLVSPDSGVPSEGGGESLTD